MREPERWVRLSERELEAWGRRLGAAAARDRVFVGLAGELGAGKTTLVRAACAAAGVRGPVTSPTFTLVHRYEGCHGPVFHVDLYRIGNSAELLDLGWDDLVSGEAPVFVEWAERAGGDLPPDRWDIRLAIADGGRTRALDAVAVGSAPPIPPLPEPARLESGDVRC